MMRAIGRRQGERVLEFLGGGHVKVHGRAALRQPHGQRCDEACKDAIFHGLRFGFAFWSFWHPAVGENRRTSPPQFVSFTGKRGMGDGTFETHSTVMLADFTALGIPKFPYVLAQNGLKIGFWYRFSGRVKYGQAGIPARKVLIC